MRRPRSLRARLTLGIAVLVLAVLAVVGLVVYYGTERRLLAALDDSLRTATAQAMAGTNFENGRLELGPGLDEGVDAGDARVPALGIVVSSPSGVTLKQMGTYRQPSLAPTTLAAANQGVATSEVRVTRTRAHGHECSRHRCARRGGRSRCSASACLWSRCWLRWRSCA